MKNLNLKNLILLGIVAVGFVLAVVGYAVVPWFKCTVGSGFTGMDEGSKAMFRLRNAKDAMGVSHSFYVTMRWVAMFTLVFAVGAAGVVALDVLGIFRLKRLYRVMYAGVVVLLAVGTLISAIRFADLAEKMLIAYAEFAENPFLLPPVEFYMGSYVFLVGAVLTSAPLFKKN